MQKESDSKKESNKKIICFPSKAVSLVFKWIRILQFSSLFEKQVTKKAIRLNNSQLFFNFI